MSERIIFTDRRTRRYLGEITPSGEVKTTKELDARTEERKKRQPRKKRQEDEKPDGSNTATDGDVGDGATSAAA